MGTAVDQEGIESLHHPRTSAHGAHLDTAALICFRCLIFEVLQISEGRRDSEQLAVVVRGILAVGSWVCFETIEKEEEGEEEVLGLGQGLIETVEEWVVADFEMAASRQLGRFH